ncbi:LanC-like protein 1 [Metarhizium album ARSEF 1941]|uniref:LanC-like protein 1 n=1 Tax=Metarhizium album (strain ARSEF 1941) TaxID=1081103 RepID=A0A0B2WRZ1_METAS|nr:LanC-like protein 1 [Metarhizium album ARSEF 1941]KHN98841.1 LanC-like protein 1 [Metarhizium album ARSEF 1941]
MAQAYLPNTMSLQPLTADTASLLKQSLEGIVRQNPPLEKDDNNLGLAAGHTALAYLFLRMAQKHADLQIHGHGCMYWAERYMAGDRGPQHVQDKNCGLMCEKLAWEAVRASITGSEEAVATFLENVPRLVEPTPKGEDPFPSEMLYGRAAVLYLLRMVRRFVPSSADPIDEAIGRICQRILESRDNSKGGWLWKGKRYYGAVHGDIGVMTQIVLSDPSLAPRLRTRLEELLDMQADGGNWPATDEDKEDSDRLVQFCHGAPGFIFALQSLRPFYPMLQERIDGAIEKGRQATWARGLLVKEPSLCHGLFGNGLALPKGEKRDHFLSLATPDSLQRLRSEHAHLFRRGSYGMSSSPLFSYLPSAAWTWTVFDEDEPRIILFNDV